MLDRDFQTVGPHFYLYLFRPSRNLFSPSCWPYQRRHVSLQQRVITSGCSEETPSLVF